MSALTRRDYQDPFAEVFDWLESPWPLLHRGPGHPMRMEDYVRDGRYVVRAELPGIDPEKDLELTVSRGVLTITARRQEEAEGKRGRSSATGSSPVPSRCPRARMRTTSRPAMTEASWKWSSA